MNLSAVSLLPTSGENGVWWRAADIRYAASAIATGHTKSTPSRFYDPQSAVPQFPTLYLADNQIAAMFEIGALYGSPAAPGGAMPAPRGVWIVLSARVQLARVVDLSSVVGQATVQTSAQELTGDWKAYRQRGPSTAVPAPTGTAPTQELGEAIHRDGRRVEGLLTISAKMPFQKNLVVLPDNLSPGSSVVYDWTDAAGVHHEFTVDSANPGGIKTI